MLSKFLDSLRNLSREKVDFDPSSLNDPVATQTEWGPVKGGGANFQTHKMVAINSTRLEFQASFRAKLFYLFCVFAGLGFTIFFSDPNILSGVISFNVASLMSLLFGLIFLTAGIAMYYYGTAPIVFDKSRGFFWKGRKAPHEVLKTSSIKHFAKLEHIYAIQLISERCLGQKRSYYSYELNLVLADGQRINVVDHGNSGRLREDAEILSNFLGNPVWDAI